MNSIYRRVEIFFTNEMITSTKNKDPNAANNKKRNFFFFFLIATNNNKC